MTNDKDKPGYKWWHYKHRFLNGVFEWVKFIGALAGIVTLIWTSCYYRYLGVEIKSDNPSLRVTFNPEAKNSSGILIPPHMDLTITAIIENHEFNEKIIKSGYFLFPKKFQDLNRSSEWKFDNKKDIKAGVLGQGEDNRLGDEYIIKQRSSLQTFTTYRLWTGDPYSEKFITELLKLENTPVTFVNQVIVDGDLKDQKGIVFVPLGFSLNEYKEWLAAKDDDPKAMKRLQNLLNNSVLTRNQNGIVSYTNEVEKLFRKAIELEKKTLKSN